MTSVLAAPAQMPANKLYTNILPAQSSITDTLGNRLPWVVGVGALSTPGAAILRDLGKTVYQPNPTIYSPLGSVSTIYRKVQLVTQGANGYYGTGQGVNDATYYTGYIALGGVTYGGGSGVAGGWVRLN
jgi:hypothetical protein